MFDYSMIVQYNTFDCVVKNVRLDVMVRTYRRIFEFFPIDNILLRYGTIPDHICSDISRELHLLRSHIE